MKIIKICMFPCEGTGRVEFTFASIAEAINFMNIALLHVDSGFITIKTIKEDKE